MRDSSGSRTKIYQGWLVLIGAFIAHMFAIGTTHYSFGLFVVPVSKELHISRADANNWLIVMSLGSAILAPIAGRLVDRFSIRLIMVLGGAILALGIVGIAATNSLWMMLLMAIGPIAFGADCGGALAGNAAVARWFRRRRGRALALAAIASSAGGFVMAPLGAFLITTYGWRPALAVMGLLAGGMISLAALLLVRARPSEDQLRESGELALVTTAKERETEQRIWTYHDLIVNRNFLLLAFGAGLLFASDRALLVSVAPYLADNGLSLQLAGFLISVLTAASIAGKLIVGYIADYVDPRKIFLVVAALHVLLLILFIVQPAFWIMMALAAVLGLGIGGVLPTTQVLTASVFGSATYGTVIGTGTVIHQLLMMATLRIIGEVRDRTGSYDIAFAVFIGYVVIAAFLVWQLDVQRRLQSRDAPLAVAASNSAPATASLTVFRPDGRSSRHRRESRRQ
jgi:MFS family permease